MTLATNMFLFGKAIKEEINFYEEQNKRLAVDDLLREVFHEKPKQRKQIKENEQRIERLEWEIILLCR